MIRGKFMDAKLAIIPKVTVPKEESRARPRFSVWSVSSYAFGRRIDRFAEPFDDSVN
jgi:hypothetical protein